MRLLLAVIAVVVVAVQASADEPVSYCEYWNSNEQYRFALSGLPADWGKVFEGTNQESDRINKLIMNVDSAQAWQMHDILHGKILYTITGAFSMCAVLVSDDGRSVVVCDEFSAQKPSRTLAVLWFYHDGQLMKQYSLGELLGNTDNIAHSASHFRWLQQDRWASFTKNGRILPPSLHAISNELFLATLEQTAYRFDLRSGAILARTPDPLLSDSAMFVYGNVKAVASNRYQMQVWHVVKGSVPTNGIVEFTSDSTVFSELESEDGEKVTVNEEVTSCIIRDGKLLKSAIGRFNECNFRSLTNSARQGYINR